MEALILGVGYAGGFAACSVWAREWARRKGLNATVWGVAGAAAGPVGLVAVGLWKAKAIPCPHCLTPMPFEARYCPTCRARERDAARHAAMELPVAIDHDPLFDHGYFEQPAHAH